MSSAGGSRFPPLSLLGTMRVFVIAVVVVMAVVVVIVVVLVIVNDGKVIKTPMTRVYSWAAGDDGGQRVGLWSGSMPWEAVKPP